MKFSLTNTWMNDPNYLAQVGHVLFGYSLILTVAFAGRSFESCWWTLAGGALVAGLKEFWYDAKYEIPKQTFWDNLLDFSMYIVGGFVGMLASFIIARAHHGL